jgi:hypothetical protein
MLVSSINFCRMYIEILEQIDSTILSAYYPAIRNLYRTDPRDLVTPEQVFISRDHAFGFVYCLLIREHKRLTERVKNAVV